MNKVNNDRWIKRACAFVGAAIVLTSTSLTANTEDVARLSEGQLRKALGSKIRVVQHMALNPVVIQAVRRQNSERLTVETINERDEKWQNSPDTDDFKIKILGNAAGRFLRKRVTAGGSYSEAFVTDKRGANVAVYPLTGDYNQGDEGKWTNSWNNGDGKVFIGEPELDASTGLQAVQISAPVLDRGTTIGVLIVGVTFDYIDERMK